MRISSSKAHTILRTKKTPQELVSSLMNEESFTSEATSYGSLIYCVVSVPKANTNFFAQACGLSRRHGDCLKERFGAMSLRYVMQMPQGNIPSCLSHLRLRSDSVSFTIRRLLLADFKSFCCGLSSAHLNCMNLKILVILKGFVINRFNHVIK